MASGLKIAACTASLNLETFFSISSAEKLSDTSQPVNSVSAPRLAPPEMKRRRVRSGIDFAASLTNNFLSTPGMMSERMRPMVNPPKTFSAANNHRSQALRHQQRQRDMHHDERDDQGHADEVNVARGIVAAEQSGEPLQLHRLPDRQARQHDQYADHDHARVKQLLHVIVFRQIIVRELAGQRRPGIRDDALRRNRQQLLAEAAGCETQR